MRLVTMVCGPPLASEVKPPNAAETATNEASAEPATTPQPIERRSADRIGKLCGVGDAPDPPEADEREQERRREDRDRAGGGTPQPRDRPAGLRNDQPHPPGRRAVQLRRPRVRLGVRIALGANERICTPADDSRH